MEKLCIHAFASGRVQGVFYRESARKKAESLRITGWVRNLEDGRVEVFACGEESAIKEFQDWLKKGPIAARVDHLLVEPANYEPHDQFVVLR